MTPEWATGVILCLKAYILTNRQEKLDITMALSGSGFVIIVDRRAGDGFLTSSLKKALWLYSPEPALLNKYPYCLSATNII